MLSKDLHYFPDPDTPELQPFTHAFVHLMFSHAEFERCVTDLAVAINDKEFFQSSADKRPNNMEKWIEKHCPDGLPEKNEIVSVLKRSIKPCHLRHLLAHGHWWEFDTKEGLITVRSDRPRPNEEQDQCLSVIDIEKTASTFDDLEAELWKLKRAIEHRKTR
jgi:hypothetical protein